MCSLRSQWTQIKKCVLELGGSDPFIVANDADIEKGSSGAVKLVNTIILVSLIALMGVLLSTMSNRIVLAGFSRDTPIGNQKL